MNDLQRSLETHLRLNPKHLVYAEMPLGSVSHTMGCQRADVLTITKSYEHAVITIYEVKQTRADFNGDLNRGKVFGYEKYSHRILFACQQGLVTKDEIPGGMGLITLSEAGWHVVKSGKYHNPTASEHEMNYFYQACMMRGFEEGRMTRELKERVVWDENKPLKERAKSLGYQIKIKLSEVADERATFNAELIKIQEAIDGTTGHKSRDVYDAINQLNWFLQSLGGTVNLNYCHEVLKNLKPLLMPSSYDRIKDNLAKIAELTQARLGAE